MLVIHSRDHEEVGMAHKIISFQSPQFSQMTMGQYWLCKTKPWELVLPVACGNFLSETEIVCAFHSDYFDYKGAFQTILNLYCCITGKKTADKKV